MAMPQALFLASLFVLPFALFAALTWLQRARWRELARELGARREPRGLFAPDAIVGERFRVEAVKLGKAYRTEIHVRAEHTPGRFVLPPEFFQDGPNWAFAKVPGARTERVFLWQITLPGLAAPSVGELEQLRAWLPAEAELAGLHPLLVGSGARAILVGEGSVATTFRGFVTEPARVRGALDALARLAPAVPAGRRSGARAA